MANKFNSLPINMTYLKLGFLVLFLIGMTQVVRAELVETELKCSADHFYGLFRNNMEQITTIFPQIFKSSKLLKGDGKSVGSIRQWKYVLGNLGKVMMLKETIKALDEENRSITFSVLEGDLLTHYKNFDVTLTVTPKVDNGVESGSFIKWSVDYVKHIDSLPGPDAHIHLIALVSKELGHYFPNVQG